jgi:hypothetical protein
VPARSSASGRLELTLAPLLPRAALPGQRLLEHPRAREIYPRYLAAGYHITCGMLHLMERALERASALASRDGVAAGLCSYLERHLLEEMHGEEPGGAVLDDLAALGVDTAAVRDEPSPDTIASLVDTQLSLIVGAHPVSILGFLELEAYHPHAPTVELLIRKTGLPRDGFRQLLLHAKLDVAHARELHRFLDSLPLEPRHEQLIGVSALHAIGRVADALLVIVREVESGSTDADGARHVHATPPAA